MCQPLVWAAPQQAFSLNEPRITRFSRRMADDIYVPNRHIGVWLLHSIPDGGMEKSDTVILLPPSRMGQTGMDGNRFFCRHPGGWEVVLTFQSVMLALGISWRKPANRSIIRKCILGCWDCGKGV